MIYEVRGTRFLRIEAESVAEAKKLYHKQKRSVKEHFVIDCAKPSTTSRPQSEWTQGDLFHERDRSEQSPKDG